MDNSLFSKNDFMLEIDKKPDKIKSRACRVDKETKKRSKIGKRYERARDVIGKVGKNEIIHYVTGGEWSMHELLEHILNEVGASKVYIASWSITSPGCKHLIRLIEGGLITHLDAIFDWRIRIRQPDVLTLAKNNFANVKLSSCHSKVTSIINDNINVSVVGSANYTNNPRLESGVIDTTDKIAYFHRDWILSEMNGSDWFDMNKKENHE